MIFTTPIIHTIDISSFLRENTIRYHLVQLMLSQVTEFTVYDISEHQQTMLCLLFPINIGKF